MTKSFFSVRPDSIIFNDNLIYDLYVNASSLAAKEKFVKIFPAGDFLDMVTLKSFLKKYSQLYVDEEHRNLYLKTLIGSDQISDVKKTEFIKDTAIRYFEELSLLRSGAARSGFWRTVEESRNPLDDFIGEVILGCRDLVISMVNVLRSYDMSGLYEMIAKLSFHDFYTYDHSINVSMYSIVFCRAGDISQDKLIDIGLGALLHDIGKMHLPTSIINNPGKLTEEEFLLVRQHPLYGAELLSQQKDKIAQKTKIDFGLMDNIVREHHENFDSTGYPQGLKGDQISSMARIVAVADFFDAITTKRSYSEALPLQTAIEVIGRSSGKRIDPEIFSMLLGKVKKFYLVECSKLKIADTFDPSQPHQKLPLEECGAGTDMVDTATYGKVKRRPEKKRSLSLKNGCQSKRKV
ncbi:MAG: HD domain-containing protein [Oligoflexia bacterium]|nr:HD domain-containing protein [Oligoflexia bacterium]